MLCEKFLWIKSSWRLYNKLSIEDEEPLVRKNKAPRKVKTQFIPIITYLWALYFHFQSLIPYGARHPPIYPRWKWGQPRRNM